MRLTIGPSFRSPVMRFLPNLLSLLVLLFVKGTAAAGVPQFELFLEPGHTKPVTSVALSSDGKQVLTGSTDSTAILWETASAKKLQTFKRQAAGFNFVVSVALSGDGQFV